MEGVRWGVFGVSNSRLHGVFNTKEAAIHWADKWFERLPGEWKFTDWQSAKDHSVKGAHRGGWLRGGYVTLAVAEIVWEGN